MELPYLDLRLLHGEDISFGPANETICDEFCDYLMLRYESDTQRKNSTGTAVVTGESNNNFKS